MRISDWSSDVCSSDLIRINGGLFDINVLVGAAGGEAIVHGGSTGGPAHVQDDTDRNRIYMVAVPKNDAVTMLVSGQIGYDAAVAQIGRASCRERVCQYV